MGRYNYMHGVGECCVWVVCVCGGGGESTYLVLYAKDHAHTPKD